MKVLIAEDELFFRCLLESTLREWGHEVVAVADGAAGWDALQQPDAPKIALLDWQMPGVDGLELCRRIRAAKTPRPTYVIMVTSREGRANTLEALRAGADDYVTKPFDREELQVRLQTGERVVGLQTSLAERVAEVERAMGQAAKMGAIGLLVGGVAHDFNNLLCVINGFGEMVLQQTPLEDARHPLMQQILNAGHRAAGLTRQLLAFSRNRVRAPEVLDVNALVTEFKTLLRRLLSADVRLNLVLAREGCSVRADPGQIEQVIMNLVVNARDAMPGGGEISIATGNVGERQGRSPLDPDLPPGNFALLAVSDTGCGMDEPTRSRIFEPFFTTKEEGKGTGLGLATVVGIVKQAGGHIGVSSSPGRGTTFRVYLPSAEPVALTADPSPDIAVRPGENQTILLAEDDEQVRRLACDTLELAGYNVLVAGDGREALERAHAYNGEIHLLLTDIVMPDMDGYALASHLRRDRDGLRVLYMSGYAIDVLWRTRPAGNAEDGFLQKPFTPSSLSRDVRNAFRRDAVVPHAVPNAS